MTLTTSAEIARAIIATSMTNDELNKLTDAIRFSRSQLAKQNKRQMSLGSTVKFTNSRTGYSMQGKVTKIAIKFVTVNCGASGSWRVPANMLEVV
jgi:translation initiation factor 2B subunit (eIF-2B alpha/beta/delta family)